mmetsp:Transcript_12738/g.15614  ORF Transcript_12738/g.15614 Transcript_12738/m.15614 type:complete len:199 (+) Transcript_12738:156-752(+)
MANFGELILVMGDLHIPKRESIIPEKFKRMLVPNKMQHVICTGNLGSKQQYDELRQLAPNIHVVAGDCDTMDKTSLQMMAFPETKVVCIGDFRIGVIHGHQILPWGDHSALAMMRRKLNVDVLITGHTHKNEVVEHDDGHFHINPGSITGAFSEYSTNQYPPSFILLAVQGAKVICYVYELIDGDVEVSKTEFTRGTS